MFEIQRNLGLSERSFLYLLDFSLPWNVTQEVAKSFELMILKCKNKILHKVTQHVDKHPIINFAEKTFINENAFAARYVA